MRRNLFQRLTRSASDPEPRRPRDTGPPRMPRRRGHWLRQMRRSLEDFLAAVARIYTKTVGRARRTIHRAVTKRLVGLASVGQKRSTATSGMVGPRERPLSPSDAANRPIRSAAYALVAAAATAVSPCRCSVAPPRVFSRQQATNGWKHDCRNRNGCDGCCSRCGGSAARSLPSMSLVAHGVLRGRTVN